MVTFRGRGQAWDPTQARHIADFGESGLFTTANAHTIARLEKMGYRREPELSPTVQAAAGASPLTTEGPSVLLQVLKPVEKVKNTSVDKKDKE